MSRVVSKKDTMNKSLNSTKSGTLRSTASRNGAFAASFAGKSTLGTKNLSDSASIEAEYIKNLQQQIYFLELEANYLREQGRKATQMQPVMTAEAERMLSKLRTMQTDIDGLRSELRRKEAALEVGKATIERLELRLKTEQDSHSREKRLLLDEAVSLRRDKESAERDLIRKEAQLKAAGEQTERTSEALSKAEERIELLRLQSEQTNDQNRTLAGQLDAKRSELLKVEATLQGLEEKQYEALRSRLGKSLNNDDSKLERQIQDLKNKLDLERSEKEAADERRTQQLAELLATRERERRLEDELDRTKAQLRLESERVQRNQTESTIETESLRREKESLVEHVSDLQVQISDKEAKLFEMERRLKQLEVVEKSLKSHEWGELNRLADGIKTLSKSLNVS